MAKTLLDKVLAAFAKYYNSYVDSYVESCNKSAHDNVFVNIVNDNIDNVIEYLKTTYVLPHIDFFMNTSSTPLKLIKTAVTENLININCDNDISIKKFSLAEYDKYVKEKQAKLDAIAKQEEEAKQYKIRQKYNNEFIKALKEVMSSYINLTASNKMPNIKNESVNVFEKFTIDYSNNYMTIVYNKTDYTQVVVKISKYLLIQYMPSILSLFTGTYEVDTKDLALIKKAKISDISDFNINNDRIMYKIFTDISDSEEPEIVEKTIEFKKLVHYSNLVEKHISSDENDYIPFELNCDNELITIGNSNVVVPRQVLYIKLKDPNTKYSYYIHGNDTGKSAYCTIIASTEFVKAYQIFRYIK